MATPTGPRRVFSMAVVAVLVIGVAIAIIAIARADQADRASIAASNSPSAAASVSATPSGTPVTTIAYADCSKVSFSPALLPLNQPADVHTYPAAPPMTINPNKLYLMTITTSRGAIKLCLQPQLAPNTVNVMVTLARNHYFDGIPFHRVVPGFVIQGGDPSCIGNTPPSPAAVTGSCGQGGPGFKFNDEPVHQQYVLGAVAMANSGADTNGSQFFVCIADDSSQLQNNYNLFGKVMSGLDVAQKIQQGDLMQSVTVQQQS